MNRRGLLAVAAVLALAGLVGTGGVIALTGVGPAGVGDPLGDATDPPALVYFDSAGAHCTGEFMPNSSASVVSGPENTEITYSRNVSLPGPSSAIGGPTFERLNESTYVLDVPTAETGDAPRSCSGVARYDGTVRIPAGEAPWKLVVKHDGERVTTIRGDSTHSLLGGSASVSGSASAPHSTSNSTDSSD